MTSAQLERPAPERSGHLSDEQYVVNCVLAQLGRPANLYRINAERLWGQQFRVNLWCSFESDRPVKPVKMTDSFFVALADDGIESVPPITRKY